MIEEVKGKEIKDFILNNIKVKELIKRPWKLNFKPQIRKVVVEKRAFISTRWSDDDFCKGFIIECLQCDEDINKPPLEEELLKFIIEHSEEHIKENTKSKNKKLDKFI